MGDRVTILALGDRTEAVAIRALLEAMGHTVRLIAVRDAPQLTPALLQAAEDDVVIVSATGGPNGFRLNGQWIPLVPAFAPVKFGADTVLISTAAATRESGLVAAMFTAGGHLIAPNGTPDRAVIVPWIGACLLGAVHGLPAAVAAANALVTAESRFSYG